MPQASDNVHPHELEKFERVAARWWDPEGEFRPLHEMNPLRLEFIEHAAGGLTGRTVVDVGCGGGVLAEGMAARGAHVTGIDLAPQSLEVARLHALESGANVSYRQCAAETLASEQPGGFDVVTCLEMLEHVPDPAAIVRACGELVRPGGTVVFSTLNRHPKAWVLAVVAAEYIAGLLPRGTHDYRQFIRPSELARWAREPGLTLTELTGVHYNPLTRSFSRSKDVRVNYLAAFRAQPSGPVDRHHQ